MLFGSFLWILSFPKIPVMSSVFGVMGIFESSRVVFALIGSFVIFNKFCRVFWEFSGVRVGFGWIQVGLGWVRGGPYFPYEF